MHFSGKGKRFGQTLFLLQAGGWIDPYRHLKKDKQDWVGKT